MDRFVPVAAPPLQSNPGQARSDRHSELTEQPVVRSDVAERLSRESGHVRRFSNSFKNLKFKIAPDGAVSVSVHLNQYIRSYLVAGLRVHSAGDRARQTDRQTDRQAERDSANS